MVTLTEKARAAVIAIASEDEYWEASDEQNVTVAATDDPARFTFAVAGTFWSDYGCVVLRDGQPDVYYHDEDTMERCEVCGWEPYQ